MNVTVLDILKGRTSVLMCGHVWLIRQKIITCNHWDEQIWLNFATLAKFYKYLAFFRAR